MSIASPKTLARNFAACLCLRVSLCFNSFAADSAEILRAARETARGWKSYTCDYNLEVLKGQRAISVTGTISFLHPGHRKTQVRVIEASTKPGVAPVKMHTQTVSDGETKFFEVLVDGFSKPSVHHMRESHSDLSFIPSQMIEELTVLFDLKVDDTATTRTIDGKQMDVLTGAYNPEHSIEDDSVVTRKQFLEDDLSQLGGMYKSATVWIGREDHMIHCVDLASRYPPDQFLGMKGENEHTTITFSAMKLDASLTLADFMYVPPPGVKVDDETGSPAK